MVSGLLKFFMVMILSIRSFLVKSYIKKITIGLLISSCFFFTFSNAIAQEFSLDLGAGGGSVTARLIQIFGVITILSLVPSILVMMTSFTRLVIVFSMLRTAMGTPATPPNIVMISLALFLTFFIMEPTLKEIYNTSITPLINEEITEEQAFERGIAPLHKFMRTHVRLDDLQLFADIAGVEQIEGTAEDTPMRLLVPAFMLSEIKRAFEIGFLIFVPFLVIDMVVASVLMSMGMMLLPPIVISLPFKIIFFVMVDGWSMVVGSLVKGFQT